MSYLVALPDGTNAEFPDNVTPEEAAKVIARQFPPVQKAEPSTLKTVGSNLLGGVAEAGLGFGAAVSPSEDLTKYLDKKREEVRQWQKENGGDTLAGMAASGAGTMAPALGIEALGAAAAPVTGGASLLLANLANAGFFGIPAFRDTYNAQKEAGASTGVALQHAFAEAGMATIGGKIIGSGGKILPKALQVGEGVLGKMGMAAAEGAVFPEASRLLEKSIDFANQRENDKSLFVDPKEAAAGALSFAGLRGVHHAMEAPQRAEAAKQQAAAAAEAKRQEELNAPTPYSELTQPTEMDVSPARPTNEQLWAQHDEAEAAKVQAAADRAAAKAAGDYDAVLRHTATFKEQEALQQSILQNPELGKKPEAVAAPVEQTEDQLQARLAWLHGDPKAKGAAKKGQIDKAWDEKRMDDHDALVQEAADIQSKLNELQTEREAQRNVPTATEVMESGEQAAPLRRTVAEQIAEFKERQARQDAEAARVKAEQDDLQAQRNAPTATEVMESGEKPVTRPTKTEGEQWLQERRTGTEIETTQRQAAGRGPIGDQHTLPVGEPERLRTNTATRDSLLADLKAEQDNEAKIRNTLQAAQASRDSDTVRLQQSLLDSSREKQREVIERLKGFRGRNKPEQNEAGTALQEQWGIGKTEGVQAAQDRAAEGTPLMAHRAEAAERGEQGPYVPLPYLEEQIRALPRDLPAEQQALVQRLSDNLKAFSADPNRAEMAAEWIHGLRTRRATRPVADEVNADVGRSREIANELDRLEQGKRSDEGPAQGEMFSGEHGRGQIFSTPAEMLRYLGGNVLSKLRQSLGLTGDTAQRNMRRVEKLQRRIDKLEENIRAEQEKYDSVAKQRDAAEEAHKQSLRDARNFPGVTLRDTAADAAHEAALERLNAVKAKLDAELEPLRGEMRDVQAKLKRTLDYYTELSGSIADNSTMLFRHGDPSMALNAQALKVAVERLKELSDLPATKENFEAQVEQFGVADTLKQRMQLPREKTEAEFSLANKQNREATKKNWDDMRAQQRIVSELSQRFERMYTGNDPLVARLLGENRLMQERLSKVMDHAVELGRALDQADTKLRSSPEFKRILRGQKRSTAVRGSQEFADVERTRAEAEAAATKAEAARATGLNKKVKLRAWQLRRLNKLHGPAREAYIKAMQGLNERLGTAKAKVSELLDSVQRARDERTLQLEETQHDREERDAAERKAGNERGWQPEELPEYMRQGDSRVVSFEKQRKMRNFLADHEANDAEMKEQIDNLDAALAREGVSEEDKKKLTQARNNLRSDRSEAKATKERYQAVLDASTGKIEKLDEKLTAQAKNVARLQAEFDATDKKASDYTSRRDELKKQKNILEELQETRRLARGIETSEIGVSWNAEGKRYTAEEWAKLSDSERADVAMKRRGFDPEEATIRYAEIEDQLDTETNRRERVKLLRERNRLSMQLTGRMPERKIGPYYKKETVSSRMRAGTPESAELSNKGVSDTQNPIQQGGKPRENNRTFGKGEIKKSNKIAKTMADVVAEKRMSAQEQHDMAVQSADEKQAALKAAKQRLNDARGKVSVDEFKVLQKRLENAIVERNLANSEVIRTTKALDEGAIAKEVSSSALEDRNKEEIAASNAAAAAFKGKKTVEQPVERPSEAPKKKGRKKAAPEKKEPSAIDDWENGLDTPQDEEVWNDMDHNILFRSDSKAPAGMDKGDVQKVVDETTKGWKNAPEVVVVQNESELPLRIQGRIRLHKENGAQRVPGLHDSKSGKVYLIADDVRGAHDAQLTVMHEIAGHRGLRGLLGDAYNETMQRLAAGNKDVAEKARQQMEKDPNITHEVAVEEVLADMAETNPEYSAVKRFFYAVKAALFKAFGIKHVSDGEVRQIVANARRFIERGPGGGGGGGGGSDVLYRSKPAQNAAEAFGRQYTDERGKLAKLNASKSHLGLAVEQAVVDMRASLRRALMLGDKKLGTQALYDLSNTDDLTSMVRAVLSNGGFKITKDAKNYDQVTSGHSASFVDVTKAISDIPGGDARAKTNTFYGGMMALRGMKVGWDKLNFKDPVQAEKDGRAALAAINADPKMKAAFDKAKDTYNEFNRGLVQFAKDTHALPEAVANAMLADKEYVPFYRVNGDSIDVLMPDGHPISLGDIRSQPFLHSLVGGDQKLMPFEDAAFKNAGVLTGLAMRNLSSKRIAYALQDLGSKAGVMQIQRGKGGAGQDVMRFRQAPMRPTGEKLQELNKAIAEKMEQREAAEKALDNGGSAAQVKELERTKAELDALLAKRNGSDDDGWRHIVIDTKGTAAEYIPTELLAQSVAGSYATLPSFLKVAGWASDILRSGVTRMPTYLVSQAIKDPFNAAMLGNLKANPVAAAIKTIGNFTGNLTGKSADAQALAKMGVLHSQVFNGTPEDMKKVYMQIAGKNQGAFSRFMAGLDHAAMTADAATREQHYRDVLNSGGSEVEAALGAREMQNFTKRGSSSTMQMITRMIPFFNAQIQGLNVMAKSAQGKMGTSELLDSKNKFYARAMGLAGMAFTYAMIMEDDPDWQKMSLRDKVNYIHFPKWLSPTDEPLRFPAPFETGMAFYSLPVAIVESMRNDFSPEDWKTVRELFANQLPGNGSIMPQLFKGTYDVSRNYNSGTGMPIEPKGMEHLSPEERYNQRTTEAAKAMSKHLVDMGVKLSPMQIEYLSNAYLGQFPQAVATMTNQAFADASKGEKPTGHASDTPLIGRFFQGKRTNDDVSHVYEQANASIEAKDTYTKKLKDGRSAEALAYFEQHKKDIALAPAMQKFQTALRNLAKAEQAVTNSPDMSGADKQEKLDRLREAKQTIAKQYRAAVQNVGAALQ